jgi:hypothetical protein
MEIKSSLSPHSIQKNHCKSITKTKRFHLFINEKKMQIGWFIKGQSDSRLDLD